MNSGIGRFRALGRPFGVLAVVVCHLASAGSAGAAEGIGTVTLMMGAPRMVGQSIRPLQPVLSGSVLETGSADAAGVLIQDIVLQVGTNSQVEVLEEPDRLLIQVMRGFVVFYTDPETQRPVVVETPLGRLSSVPGLGEETEAGSGWYSVRHDPAQPAVSPAVSTFAAIEGMAQVEGTAPVAGPHALAAGQQWRIVEGQVPGPPEAGDNRGAAEDLRDMLHRRTTELVRSEVSHIDRLVATTRGGVGPTQVTPVEVVTPQHQQVIGNNDAIQNQTSFNLPFAPVTPRAPEEETERGFDIGEPAVVRAGTPVTAVAQFVSYEGVPVDPNWNDYLTAADGDPAFQPVYIDRFDNAGFSYVQLAGPDAQVVTEGGQTFLASDSNRPAGWAIFTPQEAVADAGFDQDSRLLNVVTEGFRAVARGEHAGGGRIGSTDDEPGFAVVQNGNIQLNPDLPGGYPLLDQATDVTGLAANGQVVSDQIAALGGGRDPLQLSEAGPQLVFLSDSDTDALGNRFNFDGDELRPTELDLPGDQSLEVDRSGQPSQAVPLASNENNTVGIQFAGRGEVIAIIHHTGLGNTADAQLPTSEHFEVVRGEDDSTVQWRDGGRVDGPDGDPLELEDLNDDPELRNELFAVISAEVNQLVPADRHTVCGPAVSEPDSTLGRNLRLRPGTLARLGDVVNRRNVVFKRGLRVPTRGAKPGVLKPAGGRLIRQPSPTMSRRHIGRVTPRQ